MSEIQKDICKKEVQVFFKEMRLGIEKESQRVTPKGKLSQIDYPKALGNRSYHPYITTDFSETQMEIITPVVQDEKEVLRYLAALHDVVLRSLENKEILWPLSMPPELPVKDEDIQIAKLDKFEEVLYRRYLAKTYGKRKQMVSGIHYNFEFSPQFIKALFKNQNKFASIEKLRTFIYLKVARNYLRYRWMITYLFGASPVSEEGYFVGEDHPKEPVRSIRNSRYGYTNHEDVKVSYASIESYIADIHSLVERGVLSEEKEFYAPVRLRGGKRVVDLKENGVHYIEVRNIDLDPFAPYGITEETCRFIHLFLMYMLWLDNEKVASEELIDKGDAANKQVALEHPQSQTENKAEGINVLTGMLDMLEKISADSLDQALVQKMIDRFAHPENTLAAQMVSKQNQGISNLQLGVTNGLKNCQMALVKPYQLSGFTGMELSTQILLFDAIQRGLTVEILDEADHFLKLRHKNHVEYVKNANMTSKDTYIVPLIMSNKTVTKKILSKAGFKVPQGREYASIATALADFPRFAQQGIVVKPKSTNYGLGISIFKEGTDLTAFQKALEIAFSEDEAVLVEEFIKGTEYRFFVLNDQVHAILLRIPENVVGDGRHTISELVAIKNQDPLRGPHHRSPLEYLQLGEIETLMLHEQGLTAETIPGNEQTVYLRENSNISTGGDSVYVTDEFDSSYKQIAIEAVKTLGATICGIDLIIPDKQVSATSDSDRYGIIEANFNPAMHMHVYPHIGKGRRLTRKVLELLFPEIIR